MVKDEKKSNKSELNKGMQMHIYYAVINNIPHFTSPQESKNKPSKAMPIQLFFTSFSVIFPFTSYQTNLLVCFHGTIFSSNHSFFLFLSYIFTMSTKSTFYKFSASWPFNIAEKTYNIKKYMLLCYIQCIKTYF